MSDDVHVPAAVRYKEITATADAAAQRLREHEAAKAAGLDEEVATARQRAQHADEQREEVSKDITKLWNMAMSALWEERWMRVTQMPEADSDAAPETPKESIDRVRSAYLELTESRKKPGWSGLPRRREK